MSEAAGSYEWATYFVLNGDPLARSDIAKVLAKHGLTNGESPNSLQLANLSVTVEGLRDKTEPVGCIWLRGNFRKFEQVDQRALRQKLFEIVSELGWRLEIRRTLTPGNGGLPPRLHDLIATRRKHPNVHWKENPRITRLLLIMVFMALIVWQVSSRGRNKGDPCADALICVFLCALVAVSIRQLPYGRVWTRIRRVVDSDAFVVASMLLLALVIPPWPINLLVFGASSILVGIRAWWLRGQAPLDAEAQILREMMRYAMGSEHASIDAKRQPACLVCDYDLRELETCRCPECGTMNYYLTDRADARALAEEHGGRWVS